MVGASLRKRRDVLRAGAAVVGFGALAGCLDSTDSTGSTGSTGSTEGTDDGGDATPSPTPEPETTDATYSVSMEPVGTVEFERVPETWVANNGSWADMGVALGVEPPLGLWLTSRYHTQYYDEIPGVSVDKSDMVSLYSDGVSKELFYALDGDVHVMDPNFLMNRFKGWEQSDVDEVSENVAPFFGNSIFSRSYPWHDYRYYTLYEAFEKLSKVFERHDRYEAFASLHEEFQRTVESNLPPESERPAVAILWASGNEPEKFYPYLIDEGTSYKQWRELGVRDALATTGVRDFHSSRGAIDYETLLEIDPPVLLLRGQEAKTAEEFQNTVVEFMSGHAVASQLTAVRNGAVFRGGSLYQGPITNLVLTERAANQLYPDAFEGVSLYDPQRVADIVNGVF